MYSKTLDFWNLVDTHNVDVVIGTESWLTGEIRNAEVFRVDITTFRTDRRARVGRVFICVKNCNVCAELWVDEGLEIIAVAVKGMDPKHTWAIIGIYRAPYEDTRLIEILAARTGFSRNSTKRSITSRDLNLPQADWNGNAKGTSGNQVFINRLVRKTDTRRL